jgi:hypothetical protein
MRERQRELREEDFSGRRVVRSLSNSSSSTPKAPFWGGGHLPGGDDVGLGTCGRGDGRSRKTAPSRRDCRRG